MLSRRTGYVVADASNLYDASFKKRPELIECGCNMHGRRYFVKALEAGDKRAVRPLIAYQKIYEIEDRIGDFGPDAKLAARRAEIKPVFDALVGWCETYKKHEPPTSPLGDAVRYFTNHQVPLGRFLEDGVIPPEASSSDCTCEPLSPARTTSSQARMPEESGPRSPTRSSRTAASRT